jgi:hypothetical protein
VDSDTLPVASHVGQEQGKLPHALSHEEVPTACMRWQGLSPKRTPLVMQGIGRQGHGDIDDRVLK